MLFIDSFVAPCQWGLGLFTNQALRESEIIGVFDPRVDQCWTQEEVNLFPQLTQQFLKKYAYKSKWSGRVILPGDHDRFQNHSDNPNTKLIVTPDFPEGYTITVCDIVVGEELTMNYGDFEQRKFWGF